MSHEGKQDRNFWNMHYINASHHRDINVTYTRGKHSQRDDLQEGR